MINCMVCNERLFLRKKFTRLKTVRYYDYNTTSGNLIEKQIPVAMNLLKCTCGHYNELTDEEFKTMPKA